MQKQKAVAYTQVYEGKPSIFLTGFIHDGYGLEFANYIAQVSKEAGEPVTVFLNSQGGKVTEGFAFYDFIRANGIKFKIEGYGIVGSIATVMAAAAGRENIALAENAEWFVHRARFVNDYGETIKGNEEDLARMNAQMANVYSELTGKASADIEAIMDKGDAGYSYTAAEALDMGFIGSILPSARAAAFKQLSATAHNDKPMSEPKGKVPVKLSFGKAVAAAFGGEVTAEVELEQVIADQLAEKDQTIADLQSQIATLEASKAEVTPEQVDALRAELETVKAEASKHATAVAEKEQAIADLNTKLEDALKAPLAGPTVGNNTAAAVAAMPNSEPENPNVIALKKAIASDPAAKLMAKPKA